MRPKVIASIYAILAISFWGVSFVSTKALLVKMDPFTLVVLRFGIAALFLLVILMLNRRKLAIPLQYMPHLIVLGILGVFIHQVVQSTALLTIDASSAGWLISFSPIFTVILSILFLHEKMNLTRAAGMIVAVIGVMLVTTTRSGQSFDFSMNLGFSLMILSTLNWAVYSILLKKLNIPIPALVVTFYMSVVGFLLTLPFILRNRGWKSLSLLDSSEWAHLAFLAIFVSGVGYWYWGKALEVLDASRVSVFLYLEPLVTFLAAILLLHEKIFLISAVGGIIIIIGVMIVNGRHLPLLSRFLARK